MKRLIFILLLPFLAIGDFANSQEQEKNELIQQRIEFISEQLENESPDLTNLFDQLFYYYDNPINLNNTSVDQLNDLGLLTDLQINDLFLHIKLFGKLISKYELQSLPYWDMATIQMVLPFVRVDDRLDNLSVSLKEAMQQGKFESFVRYQTILEDKKAYNSVPDSILQNSNSYYHGNPDRYYTRLRYSYRTNLSVGLTADKDPGEQFGGSAQPYGFDFISGHAYYKGGKYIKAVALGDYQVQIGQGLNLWSGYAFGKTADVTNVKRNANALKPYTSVDENRFLRGAAVDFGYKNFSLLTFASRKKVDATIIADSLVEEQEFVSSINLSGLHRTNSEIAKKDAFTETIAGGNLRYQKRNLSLGIASVYQGYDKFYSKQVQPYNQFDFRGKSFISSSANYSFVHRNFSFFGEGSYSSFSKKFAQLHGVLIALDPSVSISILYRNYDKAYQTLYNNGFAEGSNTQNENGLYVGGKIKLNSAWTINAYADYFNFPWMRYLVDAPSNGHEFLIQPTYRPNKKMEVYFRYREQVKAKNSRNSDGSVTAIEPIRQRNYRLNFAYNVTDGIILKSRIEFTTLNRPSSANEVGMLLYQDLLIRPKKWPIDLAFRYAFIETDSYDSRLYAFETNALYVFSVPAYYYKGTRAYAMIRWTFLRKFDLWARYAVNIYRDRESLGSGAEEIKGNTKSEVTLQLRFRL
ncbi:MAG: hypothetical protein ACSHXL_04285 [Bacteroidota bacterium]